MVKKGKKIFPTFWIIVFILAAVWFLGEFLGVKFNFPWLPAMIVIIALGAIINHYGGK